MSGRVEDHGYRSALLWSAPLSVSRRLFHSCVFNGVPTETREAKPFWVPLDEIPYEQMWEDDGIWIPMMLRGERFQGRWIFDGEKMLDYELLPETGELLNE